MKKNNKKGFTLVELVIVVAVMAVLVAIAIPTVSSITGTAKKAVADTNAQTIESMIKLAEAQANKDKDGTTALTKDQVAKALVDAKLGITDKTTTYYYDTQTGAVSTSGTAGAKVYSIVFDTTTVAVTDTATVTYKLDGTGAVTG